GQVGGGGEIGDVPAEVDQGADAGGREDAFGEGGEFGFELGVGQGVLRAAYCMVDALGEAAAVFQHDEHLDLVLGDALADGGSDADAEGDEDGVAGGVVAELFFADSAAGDGGGDGVVDAELALETGLRLRLAGELEDERVDGQV